MVLLWISSVSIEFVKLLKCLHSFLCWLTEPDTEDQARGRSLPPLRCLGCLCLIPHWLWQVIVLPVAAIHVWLKLKQTSSPVTKRSVVLATARCLTAEWTTRYHSTYFCTYYYSVYLVDEFKYNLQWNLPKFQRMHTITHVMNTRPVFFSLSYY